jgi:hypothetical protein
MGRFGNPVTCGRRRDTLRRFTQSVCRSCLCNAISRLSKCRFDRVTWVFGGLLIPLLSWAAYAGVAWIRYGKLGRKVGPDPLLDEFMPDYEVCERHQTKVAAPAEATFAAAAALDLQDSRIVQGIFRARELILGSPAAKPGPAKPLLSWAKALGWGVLAQIPGREVIFGAATRPWEKNVVLRALPPAEFAEFREPGYVKIVWMLRSDAIGASRSIARSETRATTTDPAARTRFRLYWAFLSPGIVLIRRVALRMVRQKAEQKPR